MGDAVGLDKPHSLEIITTLRTHIYIGATCHNLVVQLYSGIPRHAAHI